MFGIGTGSGNMSASLAAIVMLAGLGMIYWSLRGFGVLRDTAPEDKSKEAGAAVASGASVAGKYLNG